MTMLFFLTMLFWISFVLVVYTYLGYPLCLAILKKVRTRPVEKGFCQPQVSVVIAACNEEQTIIRRIDNLLAQDYPSDKLEIIIVSDGSQDRTVEFARRVEGGNIKVVVLAQRQGKAVALNEGVSLASGELVVFCDARQIFEEDTIRQLVVNFADQTVGCVSGELMLHRNRSDGIQVEMGAYWHYEKWIRRNESASGSVVGATGAVYAIRRILYRDLPHGTLLDDVMVPMQVVMQGFRTVFDGSARAHDVVSHNVSQEWVRKVRTLAGNWQLMSFLPILLAPWKNPCCWRFVSHKLLRLIVPIALVALVVSSALLDGLLYRCATWFQLFFYGISALGGAVPATRNNRVVNLSYFFLIMNVVALAGFWRWATGRSNSVWQPAYVEDNE